MKLSKKYNFNIKTITPVHIGSGEDYLASELIKDGVNSYKRVNLNKYFHSLKSREEQNKFIGDLIDNKGIDNEVDDTCIRYRLSDKVKKDLNADNPIKENIKSFDKPYIPGSSIKGAIRTALLYNSFKKEDINKLIVNGEPNETIIDSYFKVNDSSDDSSKQDILRFLQVSDSNISETISMYSGYRARPKFKMGVKYKNKPKNFKKGIPIYFEAIKSVKGLSSSITISYDDETYHSLNFDKNKKKVLEISNIIESIYEFSKSLIDDEIEFCNEYNLPLLKEFYTKLKKKNEPKSPVLKIGYGSGILATTIALKVKKYNKNIYDEIKELVIEDQEDKNEEKPNQENKSIDKFPISRMITRESKILKNKDEDNSKNKSVITAEETMGWIKLEFEDFD